MYQSCLLIIERLRELNFNYPHSRSPISR
uniref:Uncharacterized protein n=1 Tax=Lepeophtheirus salmonis TaxID=72036 RepID=A0A0K2VE54_LEPSM